MPSNDILLRFKIVSKTGFSARNVKLFSFNDKRFIVMGVFGMQHLTYLFLL